MTFRFRNLALGTALASGLAASVSAEDIAIRYLANQGGLAAHELAQELGYFDGTGITLENLGYASGGPETLMGLAGGSLDLASAATSAVLNSIAGGNDFVIAYATNGINEDVQSIFYVLDDSPIQGIEDIAGKTIAVNTLGAHLDYTVREALHQKGLPKDAANLVVVPGPAARAGAARRPGGHRCLRLLADHLRGRGPQERRHPADLRRHGRARRDRRRLRGPPPRLGRRSSRAGPRLRRAVRPRPRLCPRAPRGDQGDLRQGTGGARREPRVAQYFRGYGVREGGLPVLRDIQFWIDVFEREGQIPEGKLVADGPAARDRRRRAGDELMAAVG